MDIITGKARRHLRALGHHLKPVILVGKEGISSTLVQALKQALTDHELIKVKLSENVDGDRHELSETLAAESRAHLVGLLGRTVLLFKRNTKKPKIEIPGDAATVKSGAAAKAEKAGRRVAKRPSRRDARAAAKTATRAAGKAAGKGPARKSAGGPREGGSGRAPAKAAARKTSFELPELGGDDGVDGNASYDGGNDGDFGDEN